MDIDQFSDLVPQLMPRDWSAFSLVVLGRNLMRRLTRDWNAEERQNNCTCFAFSLPGWCPIS